MAWRHSLLSDLDQIYKKKIFTLCPKDAHEIKLKLAQQFQMRSPLKMLTDNWKMTIVQGH